MKFPNKSIANWVLICAVVLETSFSTYFTQYNLQFIAYFSIAYFVCGVIIGLVPLIRYPVRVSLENRLWRYSKVTLATITFILASFYLCEHVYWIFQMYPIDYRNADMIPQIIVSCQRWMNGIWVYQPIPEIWNGMLPTYLPLMWMPYSLLLKFGIDVRWTTVIFFLAGIALLVWMLMRFSKVNLPQLIIILTLICSLIFILTDYNRVFFAWTEEGLPVFYYILLGYGLSRNNPVLTAIGITCCVLSRYSLFFWIPVFLLFRFFTGQKKQAVIEIGIITILTLVIFIIPYFSKDPSYFLQLPSKYSSGSEFAWKANPPMIKLGLGFAKFFSISKIQFLHNLDLAFAILIPLSFYIIVYLRKKSTSINLLFAGLSGLKLTLVFFYNFLEVPYPYLFIVNTLFSYVILLQFLNPRSQTDTYSGKQEVY